MRSESSTTAAMPSTSRGSSARRFALAFVLGLLCPFLLSPLELPPWWAQPLATLLILLLAVGVSALQVSPSGRGLLADLLVIGGLGGLFVWLRALVEAQGPAATATLAARQAALQWGLGAAVVLPILVGTAASLVAQRQASTPVALAGAALGWLGAALANVVAALLSPTLHPAAPNPEPSTSVVLVALLSVVGFAVAVVGGLLGWGLRRLTASPRHGKKARTGPA